MDNTGFVTIRNSSDTTFSENITTTMAQISTILIQNGGVSWFMIISLIVTAFLIIFGLFGNFFTIILMRKEPFRCTSYGAHLTALAIVDMLFLIMSTLIKDSTLYLFGRDVLAHNVVVCKMSFYLFIGSKFFASFNVVYICIERFVAVWLPYKAKHFLTKRVAVATIGCIFVTANIAGIGISQTSVVKNGTCLPFDNSIGAIPVPSYALIILFITAPTFLLILFTPLTVFKLVRRQLLRRRMSNNNGGVNDQLAYMNAMLVGTLVVYIVLVSVPVAARLVLSHPRMTVMGPKALGLGEFTVILGQLNCALNFVIYGILCPIFRNHLIATCRGLCKLRARTRIHPLGIFETRV